MIGVQLSKLRLVRARAQLGLRQIDLIERAGLSERTVKRAEHGEPIRPLSREAILRAINEKRTELGLVPLDDLEWEF